MEQGSEHNSAAHQEEMLYKMMLIRRFEERSAEEYTKTNIRGFLHLYVGEEATAVGVIAALTPDDKILSTYREHGHAIARGVSPDTIMAEMFGKREGCSKGRGGSMHLFDVKNNFFGGNAIVAGHLPLAVGMALAIKKQKQNALVCCFFGEGAAAEGEFHEAMNLAGLFQVPVLFVCENNRYAMGTAIQYTHADNSFSKKGAAYGIDTAEVDGMDVRAVESAAKAATEAIRTTGKPFFLVSNTYRFRAHSMFDAELYREKSEVEEWKKRDPITTYTQYLLKSNLITEDKINSLQKKIDEVVNASVVFAEKGKWEPVEDLTKHIYS